MSDRRAWARKTLNAIVTEYAVQPKRNEAICSWLLKLATAPEIAELVASFGTQKLPLLGRYIMHALRKGYDPRVGAAKCLMWVAAVAMADQNCLPVRARDLIEAREILEKRRAHAMSLTPLDEHDERLRADYVTDIDECLAIQAPPDDPIVRYRASMVKNFDGVENPISFELGHALGIRARMRGPARFLFLENGDRVVNIFVNVLTNIPFSDNDGRSHPTRSRRRPRP
jgi:hypothetical protein